jgi:hypothetical protein
MSYDIELGQGDSDNIPVSLTENGVAVNLSMASISFCMKSDVSSTNFNIPCNLGAIINGESIPAKNGAVTIPFSKSNTSVSGIFLGEFKVSRFGSVCTFPNNHHITVQIKPTLTGV